MSKYFNDIIKDDKIKQLILSADESLHSIGFTEHSIAHVSKVREIAVNILTKLNYNEDIIDLTKIACYMHDIGNAVNREQHSITGGILALEYLMRTEIPVDKCVKISTAIGCHDESSAAPDGIIPSAIAAALIIADKSDVRRSRVRRYNLEEFDIHDRVNYAVMSSNINVENNIIRLNVKLDSTYCSSLDFYEIFLSRMLYCRSAAKYLNCKFELNIKEI